MQQQTVYINHDGYIYILAERTEIARETENFRLLIAIAEEKISAIRSTIRDSNSDEAAEDAMDEINSIKMAIDDLSVHLDRLIHIPRQERL